MIPARRAPRHLSESNSLTLQGQDVFATKKASGLCRILMVCGAQERPKHSDEPPVAERIEMFGADISRFIELRE